MAKRHSEMCFVPMCTPKRGKPWFAVRCLDWSRKAALAQFLEGEPSSNWKDWRKCGWRIVKVRMHVVVGQPGHE